VAAPAVVEADSDAEAAAGVAAAASEEVAAEASAVDEAVAAEASAEDAAAEEEATVGAAGEVEATVVDAEVEEVIDVLLSALMRLLLFFWRTSVPFVSNVDQFFLTLLLNRFQWCRPVEGGLDPSQYDE